MAMISMQNVSKWYGSFQVLTDCTTSIKKGEVVEINADLPKQPELVNRDPYGQGWMIAIQPSKPAELDALLTADQYAAHLAQGAH